MKRDWYRLLQFAACRGHRDLVALSLNQGVAVDSAFEDGKTALFVAAEAGHLGVVQLLLMRGARVGALRAFTAASAAGHGAVVQALRRLAVGELEAQRIATQVQTAACCASNPPSDPPASAKIETTSDRTANPKQGERPPDHRLFKFGRELPGPA
jgi:ankyrin repeat protein